MDIHSSTWQVAVEAAGIWPTMVVLKSDRRFFVLLYHRSDGEDRVLTAGGRTCLFADVDALNRFVLGPHTGVPGEVHLALEVLSSFTPEGLAPEQFPRCPVEHALDWIAGGGMLAAESQVQQLLDTLAFLNDWHESLEEEGLVERWPDELDDAAELLTDVVVTSQVTVAEAAERLATMDLRPILTDEVSELLKWSA